jgi:hypothetical protein
MDVFSMELLEKAFGLLTAVVALVTAAITYRQKRSGGELPRAAATSNVSGLRVVEIKYAEPKRWPWVLAKWSTIPLGLLGVFACLDSGYLAVTTGSSIFALGAVYWGACAAMYPYLFVRLRREPWRLASKVQRGAQVTVQGTFEDIFARCHNALSAVGARVTELNAVSRHIRARTSWTWRSFGENIDITLEPVDQDSWLVKLSSDNVLPTTLVDYGKNNRNLRALIANL